MDYFSSLIPADLSDFPSGEHYFSCPEALKTENAELLITLWCIREGQSL